MNFLYLRPRQTWFVKYTPIITKIIIRRWFYELWNLFGGAEKILPQQFLNRFEELQTLEQLRLYQGILNYASIISRKERYMDEGVFYL